MLRIYQLPPPPWPPAILAETAITSHWSLGLPPCFSTLCNLCISPSTSFKTTVRPWFFCFSFFSYFMLFPLYSIYSPVVIYLLFICLLSVSSMRSSVRALGLIYSQQKRTVPKTLWNTVYISAVLSPQGNMNKSRAQHYIAGQIALSSVHIESSGCLVDRSQESLLWEPECSEPCNYVKELWTLRLGWLWSPS